MREVWADFDADGAKRSGARWTTWSKWSSGSWRVERVRWVASTPQARLDARRLRRCGPAEHRTVVRIPPAEPLRSLRRTWSTLDPGELEDSGAGAGSPPAPRSPRVFRPGQVLFGKRRAYLRKVAVPDFSGVCRRRHLRAWSRRGEDRHLLPGTCYRSSARRTAFLRARHRHVRGVTVASRTNWQNLADVRVRPAAAGRTAPDGESADVHRSHVAGTTRRSRDLGSDPQSHVSEPFLGLRRLRQDADRRRGNRA